MTSARSEKRTSVHSHRPSVSETGGNPRGSRLSQDIFLAAANLTATTWRRLGSPERLPGAAPGRLLINKWQGGGVPCRDYQGPVQRSKPIVAPSALSPSSSAPSARRYAASELDRSARSSKPLTAPLKHS